MQEIELHRLILGYAQSRLRKPKELHRMMYSIERFGQISPVVAVPGQGDQLILIEGYLRVEALRRLGRDTVFAEIWPCKEDEALIRVLAGTQQRHFDAIEQATLIKQLQCRFHCSLSDIARRIGRDLSWVSRRVSLIEALSEDLLDAVLKGRISTWTASRILAPLARANAGHAEALSRCLLAEPLGTRDVAEFYRHYQKANAHKRQKPARAGTARDGLDGAVARVVKKHGPWWGTLVPATT
jgi:ParB family chromosome partitioning protein